MVHNIVWSLGFVAFKCHEFYKEYINYDIRTEVRIKSDNNITLPALTICKSFKMYGQDYKGFVNEVECYKNHLINDYEDDTDCRDPSVRVLPTTNLEYVYPHFQHHQYFPSCTTINPNGTLTTQSDIQENSFMIQLPHGEDIGSFMIYFYVHAQEDIPFSTGSLFTEELSINAPGYYMLSISDKRVTRRMKHPFPSNCTNGENNESVFPGPYTFKKCKDTCLFHKMLSECGTVLDHWQQYAGWKYPKNQTLKNTRKCLRFILRSSIKDCHCPFSCNETTFEAGFRVYNEKKNGRVFIKLAYSKNTYTMIQEYEAYPKDKFLTDIGGWCGLFSGMSFLSIVEILVFITLSVIAFIQKLRSSMKDK